MKKLLNIKNNETVFLELLVNQVAAYIGSKKATYISIPITTGKRYIDWYDSIGSKLEFGSEQYIVSHREQVVKVNVVAAENKVEDLRLKINGPVVDPTKFDWIDWSQEAYKEFWDRILEKYIDTVIFLDGWQFSNGCCFEYLASLKHGITILNENFRTISFDEGELLIKNAINEYERLQIPVPKIVLVNSQLTQFKNVKEAIGRSQNSLLFKDEILNRLAQAGNIAQFISYGPAGLDEQRFLWINNEAPNSQFNSSEEALSLLLKRSSEKRVNVRSFDPVQPKGHPFVYGLNRIEDILETVKKNAAAGLYSIVNETIDINDGGVSGVALGNVIEFTPNDTPKGVDKPGVCLLQRTMGLDILRAVYGFTPKIDFGHNIRVEFSIHPMRRGIRKEHTIIWELEEFSNLHEVEKTEIRWPNNFSKIIGDKAFGLLVARNIGLPVPNTTVISRMVAPFSFGSDTGISEVWIRTAPVVRTPGKFSTYKGWKDPYKILAEEDPECTKIASVLCQQAVNSVYSGSLLTDKNNQPLIEGIGGQGDLFMVGLANIESIPKEVEAKITKVFSSAFDVLGPIEMEWVYDGKKVWVVQLHKSTQTLSYENIIVPGTPSSFIEFDVSRGLEELRGIIAKVPDNTGIKLIGNVGVTSHFGDVLRKYSIPSFVERKNS